jgi:hypothetical protein
MSYEEFGYNYGDSILLTFVDGLLKSHISWIGRPMDTEKLGRSLAILGVGAFQICIFQTIKGEEEQGHATGGLLKRLTERYDNFAFDPSTFGELETFMAAAGEDLRNPHKTTTFPTLVPLVLSTVTGIGRSDPNWATAYRAINSFIDMLLEGARDGYNTTKKNFRFVV